MINKNRLLKTFLELVQIDSPSQEEDAIARILSLKLEQLGASVETDTYGNVIGRFAGEGEPFMFNAHMDTVRPGNGVKPKQDGDIIQTDGSTVLGADPKAGVSAILEALASLKEDNAKHRAIEVVFTRSEEIGLLGAVNLDYSKVKAKEGVTFDGEGAVTNYDISSPGHYMIDITVIGRGAHAGAEPEKGISALKIAAKAISQLPLGRLDEETTCNIGLIEGGTARNAIPETVTVKGEARSLDKDKLETVVKQFEGAFKKAVAEVPEAKLEFTPEKKYDAYFLAEHNPMVTKLKTVYGKLNLLPNPFKSGGGTDNNIFQSHNINAVVVGAGDYDAHTTREYVKVNEMLDAAKFAELLVKE